VAEYAKELTDRMPGNLKVAYFVNSGRCAAGRGVRCRLLVVVVLIFRVWWRALGAVCGCFLYIYLHINCAFECIHACSEANDMAMMMARLYTHNHDIITLRNAYHGLSGGWAQSAVGGCR
jgi:alanine-glyoxylate transaminase/(R)-3-amino-2-methylpropionate-pyruvate transaminase